MKVPYSFSIEEQVTLLMKKYGFVNWSKIVNKTLEYYLETYKKELREAHIAILKVEQNSNFKGRTKRKGSS